MSAALERKLEEIQKLLDDLSKELSKGTPAIVEGKKDVEALRKLEETGDIITAKTSGRTFLDVLGEVGSRGKNEVILLLDFDERGREWTARLTRDLEGMKVKPNLVFWRRLSSLVGRDVKDIEGLSSYIQTLRERIGKNILNME
jgi:5S rRNA maturation endonuclease (ribonuclease M5)